MAVLAIPPGRDRTPTAENAYRPPGRIGDFVVSGRPATYAAPSQPRVLKDTEPQEGMTMYGWLRRLLWAASPATATVVVLWYVEFPLLEPAVTLDEVTVRR